jgi:rod shape-determining protein MreD
MRWPVFAIFAFTAVVVQLSLRNVLTLRELWGITPDVTACLVVFVALFAHRSAALWGAWMIGLLLDLAPQSVATGYHILGVNALGYTAGAFAILQMRTMVFRRRALTMGFLTVLCVIAASLVTVMLLAIRSWYPGELPYGPLSDFGRRLLIGVYSGLVAIPLGWLLGMTLPLWGFQSSSPRRSW